MLEAARSAAHGAEWIIEKEIENEFEKEFRSLVHEDASLNEASLNEASPRAFNARVHTNIYIYIYNGLGDLQKPVWDSPGREIRPPGGRI